ncbi:MAG TPA: DUF2891 domain-containing protein [Caulobacteraceae bacterium]|nr:DUF2891 domain-containing protein [Caulobacteraceae bacterium]
MTGLDLSTASLFASTALGHVTREYPHKLDHVMAGPHDVQGPRALHPIFHGSFDWHSCVHGWWTLFTVLCLHPDLPEADRIRATANALFTEANVAAEVAYAKRPESRGFERPYGWAWLLKLQCALDRLDTPEGRRWARTLKPLANVFADRFMTFLPVATYPVRTGTHFNTAFALRLAMDYAEACGDLRLAELLRQKAYGWYGRDRDCQAWEPSQDEFLSPALMEAEALRRILAPAEFREWFADFLPRVGQGEPATLFEPAVVSDRTDGKIAHLDGLNLSRAWCWRGIASSLEGKAPAHARALEAADVHLKSALPHVTGDYMGEHWLASFALLALLA